MTAAPDPGAARRLSAFEQVVFSGGGLRCFWHGGWIEAADPQARLRPSRVTGSSGGALSAAAWLSGRDTFLFERFSRALRGQDSNLTLDDLGTAQGRSPHQRIYQAVVEDVIDARAQTAIAEGPAFQISVATAEGAIAPALRALIGGTIYQAEQVVAPTPRPRLSSAVGLRRWLIDARQAARDGRLHDLIRMAATIPPAFRHETWDGDPVFDGGMVDKAPLPDPDRGRTLVLLTKTFRTLPEDDPDRVVYAAPSAPVMSGAKLDFTDPALLREAWDQGLRDGRAWLSEPQ